MDTDCGYAPLVVSGGERYLVAKSYGDGMVLFAINDTPNLDECEEGRCWHIGCADGDELYHFTHDVVPLGVRLIKMAKRHLEASFSADERHIYIRAQGPTGEQHSFILLRNDFREMMANILGRSRSLA